MIITLAQVKSLLNISGTSKDTLISTLIPEAEAKYLQIRNIPFLQISGNITSGDKTISDIRIYPLTFEPYYIDGVSRFVNYVNRMEYLFNSTYSIDNYITDIDAFMNSLEIDTAPGSTQAATIFTVYPQGSKMTAAKMIKYLMNSNSMSGLQSESVGSYSWSASGEGNPFGVPNDIYKSIQRFIDV
jgi:hypothetical protein